MDDDHSPPAWTPVPQQQQDEPNHQPKELSMQDWDVINSSKFPRNWLSTHMDNILKGGLKRYTSTCAGVPHVLDSTESVLKNLVKHAHDELKHIYLDGFEGDRTKPSSRLSGYRDTVTKVLRSAELKHQKAWNNMIDSAPSEEWAKYLRKHILQEHAQERSCGAKRKVEVDACETADDRALFTLNTDDLKEFLQGSSSVHTRMPQEIGFSEVVEIIDCDNDKILNVLRLPRHDEETLAQNLAANPNRGLICFDSSEFFPADYQKQFVEFLLHNSKANFSDFRQGKSKTLKTELKNKIEQRPIWAVNLLHVGGQEKHEKMIKRINEYHRAKSFSQHSWGKREITAWTQYDAVPFYSMTRLHSTMEHLEAYAGTASEQNREFLKDFVRRCNDIYTRGQTRFANTTQAWVTSHEIWSEVGSAYFYPVTFQPISARKYWRGRVQRHTVSRAVAF
jgi:hypothetical protein